MANKIAPDFIVIDDDPINNIICSKYIEIIFPSADIKAFTDPLSALEHMRSKYEEPGANKAFVFLDINMPVVSAWKVLDKFNNFPDTIKQHFKIFILSSSISGKDKQLAVQYPVVSGYIEKPLTEVQLQTIFPDIRIQI